MLIPTARFKMISYQGAVTRFSVETADTRIAPRRRRRAEFKQGDKVRLIWPDGDGHHGAGA